MFSLETPARFSFFKNQSRLAAFDVIASISSSSTSVSSWRSRPRIYVNFYSPYSDTRWTGLAAISSGVGDSLLTDPITISFVFVQLIFIRLSSDHSIRAFTASCISDTVSFVHHIHRLMWRLTFSVSGRVHTGHVQKLFRLGGQWRFTEREEERIWLCTCKWPFVVSGWKTLLSGVSRVRTPWPSIDRKLIMMMMMMTIIIIIIILIILGLYIFAVMSVCSLGL